MKASILIGTYTSKGESRGIYEAEFDLESGVLPEPHLSVAQEEPSYLTLSRDGKRLYAVEEKVPSGRVFSYTFRDGSWVPTGCTISGGSAPCHLMLDEAEGMLIVANYMDGVVSFHHLSMHGALEGNPQTVSLFGDGPDRKRQACAHAHQCVKYGEMVLVCDLGSDKVRTFRMLSDGIYAEDAPLVRTQPGAGPRHLVITKDGGMIYLLCELQSAIYAYQKVGGRFVCKGIYGYLQTGLPPALAGAIRLSEDEQFLFVSSRGGFDGVALFELDTNTRLPKLCGLTPTAAFPRDILPVGDFLLCACQNGNMVQVLKVCRDRRMLDVVDCISMPNPVCLASRIGK